MMNKRLWWFLMAMIILSVVGPVQAPAQNHTVQVFDDGNELYARCTSSGQFPHQDQAYCLGYVAGVADLRATQLSSSGQAAVEPKMCFPPNVTKRQTKDIVVDYLRRNPKIRHETAVSLVELALAEAWPCQ